jgi:hypothetical protein
MPSIIEQLTVSYSGPLDRSFPRNPKFDLPPRFSKSALLLSKKVEKAHPVIRKRDLVQSLGYSHPVHIHPDL